MQAVLDGVYEDDRTPGYHYVSVNKDKRRGPFAIMREGVTIGQRHTMAAAVAAVLMTHEVCGFYANPWES